MPSLTSGNSLIFSAFSLLLLSSSALAQPTAQVAPQKTVEQNEIFEFPETLKNFRQLKHFVEKIDSIKPADRGEQEMMVHQRKVARTVVAAAKKVLSQKISDPDAMQSVFFQLEGLRILEELGEPQAGQLLAKAVAAAQADPREDVQAIGTKFMVESGFFLWATWGEDEKTAHIENIIQDLSAHKPDGNQINTLRKVVEFLGDEKAEKHAQKLMAKLMPHFRTSADPQIQQEIVSLQGVERRMKLPGNKIELDGTMLDGTDLDWSSYRGKVVLVDFWATWCVPCRQEVPHVLKMYRAYHDKGFEVLGISLDKNPEQARSYIKQTKIPWPTLFSDKPSERGWKHPMAVRYGVGGIPRAILVDRDGKVVHMTAHGENLVRELRRLLGEPVARSQQHTEAILQQVSNTAPGN